jgi:hypothetical protein
LAHDAKAADAPGNVVLKYTISAEWEKKGSSNIAAMPDQTIWRTVNGLRSDWGNGITLINPANKPVLITLFAGKKQAFESACPISGLDALGSNFVDPPLSTVGGVQVSYLGYTCRLTAGMTRSGSDTGYAADYTATVAGYPVTMMSVDFSSDGSVSISRVKDIQILRDYKGDPLAIPDGFTIEKISVPTAPPGPAAPASGASTIGGSSHPDLCPYTDADGTVRYAPAGTKVTFKDGTTITLPIK